MLKAGYMADITKLDFKPSVRPIGGEGEKMSNLPSILEVLERSLRKNSEYLEPDDMAIQLLNDLNQAGFNIEPQQ